MKSLSPLLVCLSIFGGPSVKADIDQAPQEGIYRTNGLLEGCAMQFKLNLQTDRGYMIFTHDPSSLFDCPGAGQVSYFSFSCSNQNQTFFCQSFEDPRVGLIKLDQNSFILDTRERNHLTTIYQKVLPQPNYTPKLFRRQDDRFWYTFNDECSVGGSTWPCVSLDEYHVKKEKLCESTLLVAKTAATKACQAAGYKHCRVIEQNSEIYVNLEKRTGCISTVTIEGK